MSNSDSGGDSFESNIDQINKIINLNLGKWKLKIINSISHDDIRQELLIHINDRWHMYDKSRPLGNWLTTVVSRKLINLTRDNFYKFSKPCLNCPKFSGGNLCSLYGEISSECGLYRKWELEKKFHHDCALPVTIEDHQDEIHSMPLNHIDFDEQIENLKEKLKEKLSSADYKIFIWLYLENKTEDNIIKLLNYKNERQGRKQITNLKQSIVTLVKNIIIEDN